MIPAGVSPQDADLEGRVHVWIARPEAFRDETTLARIRAWLDDEERARADRYLREEDRRLFLIAHALRRSVLSRYADVAPGEWRFASGEHGRPRIVADTPASAAAAAGLGFSLSHTPGLVACLVSDEPDSGVDVEASHRVENPRALASRYFSTRENELLDATADDTIDARFLEIWTLKEAYLKARGLGLTLPLDHFHVTRRSDDTAAIAFEATIHDYPQDWQLGLGRPGRGHVLALAVRRRGGPERDVTIREMRPRIS